MGPSEVVVFDVIETLLDLSHLDGEFGRRLSTAATQEGKEREGMTLRKEWFSLMLEICFVAIMTGSYADYTESALGALQMCAKARGITLTDEDREVLITTGLKQLPPHPDVKPALERLKRAGVRMAALTNSKVGVAKAQLEHAGLSSYFEAIMSSDDVKRPKPCREAYQMAASILGVSTSNIILVAVHEWDIVGAQRAGCRTAFVARPGRVPNALADPPSWIASDLSHVSELLTTER